MRSVWIGLAGMALAVLPATASQAAGSSAIRLEMLVMLPAKGHLAVYEQVTMERPAPHPVAGIMAHAARIQVVSASVLRQGPGYLVMKGSPAKFAVRYDVPWNGRSGSYPIPAYFATGTVALLVPGSLDVPAVLNPSLALKDQGKIPGVADSPVFEEYVTTNVAPGQSLPLVLEGPAAASASPPDPHGLTGPAWARALLVALMAGSALLAGIASWRWKPIGAMFSDMGKLRSQLLGALASTEAAHRRGEIPDDVYKQEKRGLVAALQRVWDHRQIP